MTDSQYVLTKILYLPERDMLSGVVVLKTCAANKPGRKSWHRHFWVWWASTGKTITVKKHVYNAYSIQRLVNQKLSNKYQEIDEAYLLELWPNYYNDLDCSMLFEVMKND